VKPKLLVVDDDRDIMFILGYILRAEGYDLVSAFDGEEAVARYKEHRPHLVLMDIQMPVKTGDTAIREILAFDPEASIIAVTAYNFTESSLGVPVLRKGFRKEELLGAIRQRVRTPRLPPSDAS
jgi:two-component system response regulator VicR